MPMRRLKLNPGLDRAMLELEDVVRETARRSLLWPK